MDEAQIAISRDSPVPLHAQFREHLLGQIERGELRPGEQLVREHDLAAAWGVSLAPVRQAMLDLVNEGYLVRVRGRGTFVSGAPRVESRIATFGGFSESIRGQGLDLDMRILRFEVAEAPTEVRTALKSRAARQLVIERLAVAASEPIALLVAWLPAARFQGLTKELLGGGSLYQTLRDGWDTVGVSASSVVEVVRCNHEQARWLGVRRATPALRVVGVTYDRDESPIEHSDVLYRADRFRFSLEHTRQGTASGTALPARKKEAARSKSSR